MTADGSTATPASDFSPGEGCLRVAQDDDPTGRSMALCSLATHTAIERKSRLGDIAALASDGLASDELAQTCLTHIQRLATYDDEPLLGCIDRDEVVVTIVRVLQDQMTADADMLCENALAVARVLTSQGWLVVKSGGVL